MAGQQTRYVWGSYQFATCLFLAVCEKLLQLCADQVGCFFPLQIWGFEVLDEKRYYVRHVVVRKDKAWKQARLVYDYQG